MGTHWLCTAVRATVPKGDVVTHEERRLEESIQHIGHWKRWGPYLSERAWGTVREDYSPQGTAWDHFPHDHARSKAYRWGEDGIGGIGVGDRIFLEHVFHKLLLNFTWWVNRKDAEGKNIFQGGFLGLDNIGVFDRSAPLPTGGYIEQSDATAWMGMYCLNMLAIALELARDIPAHENVASKFFEHFVYIAHAMDHRGGQGIELWDEEDGFYYDVLHLLDGSDIKMRVRSMVGLIPLFAVETLEPDSIDRLPGFKRRMQWFIIIEALQKFHYYFGDGLKVECPTGSRQVMNLWDVAADLSRRLPRIFLRGTDGRRPVNGAAETLQSNPHWRDLVLFYEYFHGDNGAGIGASHQTGWTGLVAKLLQQSGE
jgi:hypothetical protein